jgi:uncharacterized membrane protein YgaE (UPF0421/DUF939 family)
MESAQMTAFSTVITNWIAVTLGTAIAISFAFTILIVVGIGSLKLFNGLMVYMNTEIVKTKNTIKENIKTQEAK